MLVVCFVLGRTAQVPPEEQYKLGNIHYFKRYNQSTNHVNLHNVPRMANRQLKYLFLSILNKTMDQVLRRLDRVYRSSRGCHEWLMAFYGVVGLAMTFEDLQNTVHGFLRADVDFGKFGPSEAEHQLRDATGEIDKRFNFMAKLFRLKYHRQFNPLRDYTDAAVQHNLGEEAIRFVTQVSELVSEKCKGSLLSSLSGHVFLTNANSFFFPSHSDDDFLCGHQHVAVSLNSDMNLYYGRLVSQFLCSFFGPSAQQ
jgi:hypothetical protein